MEKKKIVLDANSLIKFKDFIFMNYDYYITEGVIKEISDENSKKKLNNILPLLKIDRAEEKDINFIKYFSKLTGDYDSLSEVDLEVIALTYMLHRKYGDISKLKSSPLETIFKYDDVTYDYSNYIIKKKYNKKIEENENTIEEICSYNSYENLGKKEVCEMKNNKKNEDEFEREDCEMKNNKKNEDEIKREDCEMKNNKKNEDEFEREDYEMKNNKKNEDEFEREDYEMINEIKKKREENVTNYFSEENDEDDRNEEFDEIYSPKRDNKKIIGSETIKEEVVEVILSENDDEDGKWINLNNIDKFNLNIDMKVQFEANISCVTTDYAMQNVLYQIGLNVITIDGYKINSIKLWGYFCTSCYFFMRQNCLLFCSKCGNNNLRKVNVIVDNDIKKLIVKIPKFRINNKNTIFSIPRKNKKNKFEDKLRIFREDELFIGGRKQYLNYQKKLYESQIKIKNPFNDNNFYDYNNWSFRTTLKNGKVVVLKNPKIVVGGKRNSHKKKR